MNNIIFFTNSLIFFLLKNKISLLLNKENEQMIFSNWDECFTFITQYDQKTGHYYLKNLLKYLSKNNFVAPKYIYYGYKTFDKDLKWHFSCVWEKFFVLQTADIYPVYFIIHKNTNVNIKYNTLEELIQHLYDNSFFYFN